jgi:hypothetical protein
MASDSPKKKEMAALVFTGLRIDLRARTTDGMWRRDPKTEP